MEAAVVLGGETVAAGDLLDLFLAVPAHGDLRADGAAVAPGALEGELDPLVAGVDGVAVEEQGAALVGDDDIERARIEQVGHDDGAAVKGVGDADGVGDVDELARAVVEPNALLLVAGVAAAVDGGPVIGVGDDGGVAARDLGEVVPVAALAVERNVAVGEVEIEGAVVVEVAELGAEAPAAQLDAEVAGHVLVADGAGRGVFLGHPQVVALDEDAFFGDVGDVDRVLALVEDVADRDVHAAFGGEADAAGFACLVEALAVVEVELGNAVVVGDEEVGVAGAAEVGGGGGERPAMALDAELGADLFKAAVAEVVKEVFAAAVLGVFEAVRHDLGRLDMP